jgi:molybdopterin-guanine dinucleotide biosynthesis protein A
MSAVVGAILAGGLSRRFGTDKAVATAFGKPLIDHAINAVSAVTQQVVICGRDWPGHTCMADRPAAGLGPLSGLAAALHYARVQNVRWVLSLACDTPSVDPELLHDLAGQKAARFVADHPVIGLWPSETADELCRYLSAPGSRSMRRWAEVIGATPVHVRDSIVNINYEYDFQCWINQFR